MVVTSSGSINSRAAYDEFRMKRISTLYDSIKFTFYFFMVPFHAKTQFKSLAGIASFLQQEKNIFFGCWVFQLAGKSKQRNIRRLEVERQKFSLFKTWLCLSEIEEVATSFKTRVFYFSTAILSQHFIVFVFSFFFLLKFRTYSDNKGIENTEKT